MPSCVALGCQRRGDAVLKIFPQKDRRRRKIWVERVNRPGWTPTKYSALCEHHFDRDQWELPREDGKRKLKDSALPTVFVVPPPPSAGTVLIDHSYCLPFYRKIYEDGEFKADPPVQGGETVHIEHIKVETDENENFCAETVGEEDEAEQEEEESVESIQCTPDISVYPEKGEPFPIEMVDCANDDINAFMAEPDSDPLAVSAEDQVQAATVYPFFGNSKKFLFIPKETKMVVNISPKTNGDPDIKKSSEPVVKPTLKVKSLDGLLDPNLLFKSSSSNAANVDSKTILRSPSAVYLKEKLTLSNKPVADSVHVEKPKSPTPKQRLEVDETVVTLTSPHFTFPPKLKVTSTTDTAPPRLNLLSEMMAVQKDQDLFCKTTNSELGKTVVLPPRPNIFINNKKNAQQILAKKNIKIAFKSGDDQIKKGAGENLCEKIKSLSSIKKFIDLKKFVLAPKNIGENISKQTIDGIVGESNFRSKQIGINNARVWLDTSICPDKNKNSASLPRSALSKSLVQNKETPVTKKSSVIVLKPIGPYKSLTVNTSKISSKNLPSTKSLQEGNQFITMYPCDQCQISFTSPSALQLHKYRTGHYKKFTGTGEESQEKQHDRDEGRKKHIIDEEDGHHKKLTGTGEESQEKRHVRDEGRKKHIIDEEDGHHKKLTGTEEELQGKRIVRDEGRPKHIIDEEDVVIDEEDVVIVETSESSNESLDSESEDDNSSVIVLSESDSETDTAEEILSPCDNSNSSVIVLSESDSETDTAEEILSPCDNSYSSASDTGTDSTDEERKIEFEVAKKNFKTKSILKQVPRQSENSLVKVPDLSALKNLKSYKFLKLSSIVNSDGKEPSSCVELIDEKPIKNINRKRKSEAISFRGEHILDRNRIEHVYNKEEIQSAPSVKLSREYLSNNKIKISQKPEVSNLMFTHYPKENGLVALSSSSSFNSGSSSCGSNISYDDGDVSPNHERKPAYFPSEENVNRISEISTEKKKVGLKPELLKPSQEHGQDYCSLQSFKEKVQMRKPIVLLSKIDPMKIDHLKRANNSKVDPSENVSEIFVSDDEDLSCQQETIFDEMSEKSIPISKLNINSEKVQDKMTMVGNVSKEQKLTFTDEDKIKKKAQEEKPIILLPKLNLNVIKMKTALKINCNKKEIENKSYSKFKEDELIIGGNCKSNVIESASKVCGKEINCIARKTKENLTLNTHSVSLPPKVKAVENNNKNIVVRSTGKHICYEKYKLDKLISQNNVSRINHNNVTSLEEGKKEGLKSKLHLKSLKTCTPAKQILIEGKEKNKNLYEKSLKFPTRKCKICGETVQKSQFKLHVYLHMEMTSVCKVCKKQFPHSVLLRRHMKTDHSL